MCGQNRILVGSSQCASAGAKTFGLSCYARDCLRSAKGLATFHQRRAPHGATTMATPSGILKYALFRPTSDGWVFRSPNPWVFGDTPHYLVNDAQKAQIEAIVTPKRPAVVVALYAGGLMAWAVAVATLGLLRSRGPNTGRHRFDGLSHPRAGCCCVPHRSGDPKASLGPGA